MVWSLGKHLSMAAQFDSANHLFPTQEYDKCPPVGAKTLLYFL